MRKTITLLFMLLATFSASAKIGKEAIRANRLNAVVNEYKNAEGFNIVKVGKLGTLAVRSLINTQAVKEGDEDMKAVSNLIRGVRSILIAEYDDCSASVKESMNRKLGRILTDDCLIMEAGDGKDKAKIYGILDEKSDKLSDLVMYVPQDCALIFLCGSLSLKAIEKLAD